MHPVCEMNPGENGQPGGPQGAHITKLTGLLLPPLTTVKVMGRGLVVSPFSLENGAENPLYR